MSNNSSHRSQFLIPLIIAMTLAIGVMLGYMIDNKSTSTTRSFITKKTKNSVVDEVLGYIEAKYVDSIDINGLNDKAISAVLEELDPHTNYIAPQHLNRVNEELNGNFEGIGVQFHIFRDTLLVVKTIEGGPSEKAGLLGGDKILKVNNEVITSIDLDNEGVFQRLKGEKGSEVSLEILRNNKEIKTYTVIRDQIPIRSIETSYQLNDSVGYIKINSFNQNTYKDFMQSLEPLVKEGTSDLIIDLRQNGGGYLGQATDILNQLFENKTMLVYTEGEHAKKNEYKSTGKPFYKIDGIVILTDENTASASEIMAGAIQDNDRGWIVGRRTFGKGLVQEQYLLKNGGALRVTVSKYYTPSGRSIQKPYSKDVDYDQDILTRIENGELIKADTSKSPDSLEFETMNGRIVYGEGGITPDYFVGLDSLKFQKGYEFYARYLYGFSHVYLEKNRAILMERNIKEVHETLQSDITILPNLKKYATKEDSTILAKQIPLLSIQEQQLISKDFSYLLLERLFSKKEYYSFLHASDNVVKQALKAID